MATYAIGDIQGCYHSLLKLLEHIQFGARDTLWFTGDLVNRGSHSLETLRFVRELNLAGRALTVLGNHDLGMLAILRGAESFIEEQHTFDDIVQAEDKEILLSWLEQQPLLHHDPDLNYTLVHAGIYPAWDLEMAQTLAQEAESHLKNPNTKLETYHHLYGNEPHSWSPGLKKYDRFRFIINSFTRMRFCNREGKLDLESKGSLENPPLGYLPWFKIPDRKSKDNRIIFGHWAALRGKTNEPNVFAIDTGCVWGHSLTAIRLEDQHYFSVPCQEVS